MEVQPGSNIGSNSGISIPTNIVGSEWHDLRVSEAFSQKHPKQSSPTPVSFWVFAIVWLLYNVGQRRVVTLIGKNKLSKWRSIVMYLFLFAPLLVLLQQFLRAGGTNATGLNSYTESLQPFLLVLVGTMFISPYLARLLTK